PRRRKKMEPRRREHSPTHIPERSRGRESSCVALQKRFQFLEDDLLPRQGRQVVRPFPRGRCDRPESVLEQRDLETCVRKDPTATAFDYRNGIWIRIAHDPTREDPNRDPRRRAVDEPPNLSELVRGELRGPEANHLGFSPVGVRPFRGNQIFLGNRDRLQALHTRAPELGRYALQMKHRTGAGGGERRAEPLEVSLSPAEAAEERKAVAHSLSGDESDQRVVDTSRFHADLHDYRGFSTLVR